MDRKNLNRGFKKLRGWQDPVSLYVLACNIFADFPFDLKKVAANSIDAAHSVSRNIAEGYCRRSLKEYLNHLNIARGSCGEFHSCYFSCRQAQKITQDQYEPLDQLHYKVENALLMKWHPHIHLIVTGGGLSLDGKRWIRTDPRFLMYHGALKKRWKYQVCTRMKKAHRQDQCRFPKSKHFLSSYPHFASMINKLWLLTWYAYIGASLLDPRFSIQYIGRYTKRAVMAEYRIVYYDGKIVRFSFKDYAQGGKVS